MVAIALRDSDSNWLERHSGKIVMVLGVSIIALMVYSLIARLSGAVVEGL